MTSLNPHTEGGCAFLQTPQSQTAVGGRLGISAQAPMPSPCSFLEVRDAESMARKPLSVSVMTSTCMDEHFTYSFRV